VGLSVCSVSVDGVCSIITQQDEIDFGANLFWDTTPYSSLKVLKSFRTFRLHLASKLPSKKAACFDPGFGPEIFPPETTVDFQRNTLYCIVEDTTFRNKRCENLKSYTLWNIYHIV
jgi:hypothetical protein